MPERRCIVCGRSLPPQSRGRPALFCPAEDGSGHSDCQRLHSRMGEIAALAVRVAASLKKEEMDRRKFSQHLMALRSHLWRESNIATNVGRLWGAPGRRRYKKRRDGWWRNANRATLRGMHTLRISAYSEDHARVLSVLPPLPRPPELMSGFLVVRVDVSDPEALEQALRNAGAHSVYWEEEASAEASETPEAPSALAPFKASFTTPAEGQAFSRAVSGWVVFSEPPVGWEDGRWCVYGHTLHPAEVGAAVEECGGALL